MDISLRKLSDNSVTMMSTIGQVICTFHTMQEAVYACREWSHANDDISLDALDCLDDRAIHEDYV